MYKFNYASDFLPSIRVIFLVWSIFVHIQYVIPQGNHQSPVSNICVFSPEVLSAEIKQARTFAELVRPFMTLVRIALYCAERIDFTYIANDSLACSSRLQTPLLSSIPDYVQSAWFYHLLRAYDTLAHPEIGRVHGHMSCYASWRQVQKAVDKEGRNLLLYDMYDAVDTLVCFLGDLAIDACHGAGVSNSLRPVRYVKQILVRATIGLRDLANVTNLFIDRPKQKRKNIAFLYAFILTSCREDFNMLLGGGKARHINPRWRKYVSLQRYIRDYRAAPFVRTLFGMFGLLEAVFICNQSYS